jgi:hypothetical protein
MSHHAPKDHSKGKEEVDNVAAAKEHMRVAMSDYHVQPRLDYSNPSPLSIDCVALMLTVLVFVQFFFFFFFFFLRVFFCFFFLFCFCWLQPVSIVCCCG